MLQQCSKFPVLFFDAKYSSKDFSNKGNLYLPGQLCACVTKDGPSQASNRRWLR